MDAKGGVAHHAADKLCVDATKTFADFARACELFCAFGLHLSHQLVSSPLILIRKVLRVFLHLLPCLSFVSLE